MQYCRKMERFETFFCVILLFCPFKSVLTLSVEPVCSKFAYEEQLLEKMVRMEFFVENMQKDVQKSITNVMDGMNGIKEKNVEITDNLSEKIEKVDLKVENVTNTMNGLKDKNTEVADNLSELHGKIQEVELKVENVTDTIKGIKEKNHEITDNLSVLHEKIENVDLKVENALDTMKGIKEKNSEVVDNLSELHGKMKKLELKVENIVDKIDRNSNDIEEIKASKTPAVAFNARVAVKYSGSSTVVFSIVILNEDKAYNDKTGIFTAPIDGVYQFNAHLCFARGIEVEYYLKVGDRSIASGEYIVPQGATDTKCTSFSAVALVRKGEKVRVGGMSFKNLDQEIDDWNSFSGVLIQTV
ncbi:uncharacterized protein LOC128546581 [Mercenaria mercenaria]|uniref:uncharacterized protein LOC128546581 n=1 Tax=Mercenaria mercenaria TaxID=6596 RepID=UPI00234F88D1|nr:uncharacterized protein LOC128546581 [Mercenaria mercenaria]